MRGLLSDIFDLLGRLRSLADPSKATPMDEERFASNYAESKPPAGVDLLDALHAVEHVASAWETWGQDMHRIQNDKDAVEYFGAHVLDRHPEVDGLRDAWSVQDAVDRWGVERMEKNPRPYTDDPNVEELASFPTREWRDPLLTKAEAIKLAGSARTLRRWEKDRLVSREGRVVIAGIVTDWYRHSDLVAAREAMEAKMRRSQFRPDERTE